MSVTASSLAVLLEFHIGSSWVLGQPAKNGCDDCNTCRLVSFPGGRANSLSLIYHGCSLS